MINGRMGCADLRRFIRYLYEYENGQRVRNVGFVKVEERENATSISIHGKGLRINKGEVMKLYIFYMDENVCRGIWQGDIANVNPALNYRLIFTDQDTGRPENYSRIEGIILEMQGERKLAALWNDMELDVNRMLLWDEEMDSYIPSLEPQIKKIDRKDIAKFPRCEWRLANNSFLVHGYHNYHHLIIMEDEEGFWLGVPGIYHEREAKAAEAFGFPRFLKTEATFEEADENEAEKNEAEKIETEKIETEQFGYWCRKVRKGM